MSDVPKTKELEDFATKFWADEQKRADAAGMNITEYQMQANDGLLKSVILKILRHIKAHPNTCPPDCAWQQSMKELKEKYGVK